MVLGLEDLSVLQACDQDRVLEALQTHTIPVQLLIETTGAAAGGTTGAKVVFRASMREDVNGT